MTHALHRGADAVVASLREAGVTQVFTVSGNHVMAIFDAALDAGLRLVHARHEAAAVHMADAWGRLTGEPGVALVTGGPGHANAVSALFSARQAESPMLLLSGHAPLRDVGRGAFQEMHQAELARPLTKASWTLDASMDVRHEVRRALGVSRRDRPGPVHVSLPSDVLESEASRSEPGPEETVAAQGLNVEQAEEIVEWLGRASRPLVLAGPQARTPRLRAQLETLRDALGLPCLAMESPRGLQDPALGALAEVARCADAILLVGKRVDFTLAFGDAFDPGTSFMQVDPEVAEIERARKALGGRLRATLLSDVDSALAALLPQRSVTRHQAWCDEVDAAVLTRPVPPRSASGARMHPLDVARALRPLFVGNPGAIMVADGGEFAQWAQAVLDPARRIINGPAGAIGPALPMAVAARLCHPDQPVVAFLGDGTFGFHAAEIDTAVRYGLPFLAVVGNDARWNAEYQIQLRTYGPARTVGCELLPTRYDMVATGFGGYGECVANAEQLDAAVTRALDSGLPACLNVAIESVAAPSVKRVQA